MSAIIAIANAAPTKSIRYHHAPQNFAKITNARPVSPPKIICFFADLADNASNNNQMISVGKNMLYASVSACPQGVLPMIAGSIASIVVANTPPTGPEILYATRNVKINERKMKITGK